MTRARAGNGSRLTGSGSTRRLSTQLWPTPIEWEIDNGDHPHEAHFLSLDSTKARELLGWRPGWDLTKSLGATVDWFEALQSGEAMSAFSLSQIEDYTRSPA